MQVVESLSCSCTPGKIFASRATLHRHQQSKRHLEFSKRCDERDLRVRLAEAEGEIAVLKATLERVSDFLRSPSKRAVSSRTKKTVAARARWRCEACREIVNANYEIDHTVPLFRGGSNDVSNLQCLCPDCHRDKTAADREKGPGQGGAPQP